MAKPYSARLPALTGFAAVVLLLGGIGAWGVGTEIAGAVVAPGTVRIDSERQVVQHAEGGVVGEILASDGDVIEAGDVLIRLDDAYLAAELLSVD